MHISQNVNIFNLDIKFLNGISQNFQNTLTPSPTGSRAGNVLGNIQQQLLSWQLFENFEDLCLAFLQLTFHLNFINGISPNFQDVFSPSWSRAGNILANIQYAMATLKILKMPILLFCNSFWTENWWIEFHQSFRMSSPHQDLELGRFGAISGNNCCHGNTSTILDVCPTYPQFSVEMTLI